ncbi:glycosyltransferase family 9 protein [Paraburkholderia bonniea]|uniref:glycosyltransferase family 9 protein n=1 Tax=Paraburkholderia bonniea TaxID=2152891 RepID=UPI0012929A56|nr:glycosyltransferase family 9 protein [Paraburkholderia bonniea]WJF91309.1 glycosyltransferase family 9 protein [Paraburkholderia bonniea]WJF94624.1 glycosyltransferase family 9 protein [Paraburkholderia bonniea]
MVTPSHSLTDAPQAQDRLERLRARAAAADASAHDWLRLGQALQPAPLADPQRHRAALEALVRAWELDPSCAPDLLSSIAQTAFSAREWRLVDVATARLLALDSANVKALFWRAGALQQANLFTDTERLLREAVRLAPDDPLTHHKLGLCFKEQGRFSEAEATLRYALSLRPDNAYAAFDLAEMELRTGRYAEGWARYEARIAFAADDLHSAQATLAALCPYWQGESLTGKVLIVYGEQGMGDCLWAARFLPLLAQRVGQQGGRVIFGHDGPLRHLLERMLPADVRLETTLETRPDFHCGLMSLPLRLGITEPAGWGRPYLSADPARIALWHLRAAEAAPGGKRKVGLVWNGNPAHIRDASRSVPAAQLERLLQVPGITFFALSPGRSETVAQWHAAGIEIVDLTAQFETGFDDVAALLVNLDLVVTVDSGPAHLAGALGVPTCLMIDYISAWFWEQQTQRTPWYDTLELFRQTERDNWEPVLEALRHRLLEL